jgi:hypothetical protein
VITLPATLSFGARLSKTPQEHAPSPFSLQFRGHLDQKTSPVYHNNDMFDASRQQSPLR